MYAFKDKGEHFLNEMTLCRFLKICTFSITNKSKMKSKK